MFEKVKLIVYLKFIFDKFKDAYNAMPEKPYT